MTRVFYCSTLFGAMTLAAAIDAGQFGPHEGRRLLIVSSNGGTPEAYPDTAGLPGFAPLRDRFDEIVSWNELIAPLHPSDWSPRSVETPMLERLIADRLGLHDGVDELVLESIPVPPSRTLATLIRDCPITIYADGLMSYGPTRSKLPNDIGDRITRLLHLDLVERVRPVLLREWRVPSMPIPNEAFLAVVASVPATGSLPEWTGTAPLIVGQYLSALDILTVEEENRLHADMLRAVVARGHKQVLFKSHPAAGSRHNRHMAKVAKELGVELAIAPNGDPAELMFRDRPPALVVGCFSTALSTASRLFGIPIATMGTELLLERLTPYENSNRIPTTIADATMPRLLTSGEIVAPPSLPAQDVVEAVAYCMQAPQYPELRRVTRTFLAAHGTGRYFKNRRLASLELIAHRGRTADRIQRLATDPDTRRRAAARVSKSAEVARGVAREQIRRRTGR